MNRRRNGMTLIEVIVVVMLIGLIAGVVTLTLRPRPADHTPAEQLRAARTIALANGKAQHLRLRIADTTRTITIEADGSVLAAASVSVNRYNGAWINAR